MFQNRYKSILRRQDPYLLELVRHIGVRAKSIAAYRAVKELGAGENGGRQPSQLDSVRRQQSREKGGEIVKELGISMVDKGNA